MRSLFSEGYKKVYALFLFFLIGIIFIPDSFGTNIQNRPILIISSYNPEASSTAKNISAFIDEYKHLGGQLPIVIENMNCGSFTESRSWKGTIKQILDKHSSSQDTPALVILLGQEAWSSYLTLGRQLYEQMNLKKNANDSLYKLMCNAPVICGMVSRNAIMLPEDGDSPKKWEPQSIDMLKDVPPFIKMAGYVYQYDVEKNLQLIKKLYPATKNIALITDNTYGGVCFQAFVKKEIKRFSKFNLILLDGRQSSIYTIIDRISSLPANTVILLGTWRVDKNNGYFMNNATYMMMDANPRIPAFSVTSIGLGHWAIGGLIPEYRMLGKDMALQAYQLSEKGGGYKTHIEFISNRYKFDSEKVESLQIERAKLPVDSEFINEKPSFFEEYKYIVFGVVFVISILLFGWLISLYHLMRTKKLKDELEISEAELRIAKEKAEESERLKTSFLANMTHEIRTPLNAIVGFSNVLAIGGNTQEEVVEYNKVIQTNSDLLLRLVNDILDISRLETGRLKFYYEECNVTSLCKEAYSSVESTCDKPIKFILNSPDPNFVLVTDVHRLQQVLLNLLSNASKFTKEGIITLDFKIDEKSQMVHFTVTDTGEGIPEGKEHLVFDRFEKLNEFKQGTGLGLAISKTIVSVFGGEIWVDASYKEGARFIFTHPIDLQSQDIFAK
ncbi:ATP-binding protein [Bacteroides sedimenti]|uniref:sensor histidine kinase n=1 Tax=Bacteroides sedimenti TaxID=2136147 RepID=UPI003DA7758C